ncbi:hypothetical protein [Sneathiella sp.]|uniref:hypothetical protein n=1 Tax=Sneathiella sp. TaxID=1964365 RepID=UPI0039E538B5
MRFSPELVAQFSKSVGLGALTGIVLAIVFIAMPGAAILFVVGVFNLSWDLSWFPDAITVLVFGALAGGGFAGILFIKDRYIPYVEEVHDFEEDPDDPFGR